MQCNVLTIKAEWRIYPPVNLAIIDRIEWNRIELRSFVQQITLAEC